MRIHQPIIKNWIAMLHRLKATSSAEQVDTDKTTVPNAKRPTVDLRGMLTDIRYIVKTVWHLSDDFSWMAPLPYAHRRGILLFSLVIAGAILWPTPSINTDMHTSNAKDVPIIQAQLRDIPQNPIVELPTPSSKPPVNNTEWQSYTIQPGKTLAQLFRDNNLTVNDVFAMAQVEGTDKPLSNLQVGQEIKIQRNALGDVVMLMITTSQNTKVRFVRQADGSYHREG
jgi:cell envelope opacity-associated protein A